MRALALILVPFLLLSCRGKTPSISHEIKGPVRTPVRLEFEKEISGRVRAFHLKRPSGIALNTIGELYISDTGNHRLIKFDKNLAAVHDYGGYGVAVGKFQEPQDIYIDRSLNLYVVDSGNRRIVQLDASLNYVDDFKAEDDPEEIISVLGKLTGVQVSAIGEVTVADYDNSRLIRMDNFKRFNRYIGDFGYGEGTLLNPLGLAQDKKDRIYVADAGNGRIAVFDDYGNYAFQFGQEFLRRPSAICIDANNNVWIGDEELNTIFVFGFDGKLLFQQSSSGPDDLRFGDIAGLAVSPNNQLYVADAGLDRIMVYNIFYEEN